MANLLFKPAELAREVEALRGLADRFLDRTSPYRLEDLAGAIGHLQGNRGAHTLEIPENRPLRTRLSNGEFEPQGRRSTRRVFGSITGIWEVTVGEHHIQDPDRPNSKARTTLLVGFTGKASTAFEVVDNASGETIARWKMELGHGDAPGCFFHTFASAENFPVPRHPNVFATPMSSIGFALGELFQSGWEEAVSRTGDAPNQWRVIQARRFKALLGWQLKQVEKTNTSPWCSLKVAKPDRTLFL